MPYPKETLLTTFRPRRRVVVTGVGMITSLGLNTRTTWEALLASQSRIRYREDRETALPTAYKIPVASIDQAAFKQLVDQNTYPNARLKRNLQRMDLFIQYGMQAAREAILDAKLDTITVENPEKACRIGVSIGSGIGGLHTIEAQHLNLIDASVDGGGLHKAAKQYFNLPEKRSKKINPFFIPGTVINMLSGLVSMMYSFKGPNLALVTACTTGTHNIGLGARFISYGDADIMIVGGAEHASTDLGIAGFSACRALATTSVQEASVENAARRASRPWNRDRNGFVLGDGAGVLVLESYEHAKARNAPIYAELCGFGMSADAYDLTAPPENGEGAVLAMTKALADACLSPENIDYINAHATSTQVGDIAELNAIQQVFGAHTYRLAISATKSMTGHMLGAAGGIEAGICVLAIRDQIAPPTINLDQPDVACDPKIDLVPHSAKAMLINRVLSNSFGFGGTNGSLIFGKMC
jgi:3-oxoacyl-[acyl-carrier-protein] synthase II